MRDVLRDSINLIVDDDVCGHKHKMCICALKSHKILCYDDVMCAIKRFSILQQ